MTLERAKVLTLPLSDGTLNLAAMNVTDRIKEMKPISPDLWNRIPRAGDIGLNLSKNPFAYLQRAYHKRYGTGNERASHGFAVAGRRFWNYADIIEANGIFVKKNSLKRLLDGSKKVWLFRHRGITQDQKDIMLAYLHGALDARGHYSVRGIAQFALQYVGIRKKLSDQPGVFCTELTGLAILRARLPYSDDMEPFMMTPSDQLNWMLTEGNTLGWELVAYYDGDGTYYAREEDAVWSEA